MNIIDKISIIALKVLKIASVVVACSLIVASSYTAWDMYHTEKSAFSSYNVSQYRPNVESGEPATLEDVQSVNEDTRAWLTIYGTNIDYPVPQGENDLEYVNKDIYGNTTPTGSIYLATQNSSDFSDPYNLTYGHHMDNGAMFGDVDDFLDKTYFDSHTTGVLITPNQVYDLELIGAVETYAYDSTIYNPKSTGLGIVDYIKANATQYRATGEIVKVIGLSTCDYDRTNGRDVVFFKATPHEGEYIYKIDDPNPPLGHKDNYWALLNLFSLIVTVYCVVPIHILASKFRRKKHMEDRNAEVKSSSVVQTDADVEFYNTKKFSKKMLIGTTIEIVVMIIAVVVFLLTEDLSLPIKMIDKWTPLMILFMFIVWMVDVLLCRLKVDEED